MEDRTRILSIETSGRFGSLAVHHVANGGLVFMAETELDSKSGRTAQTLAPALKQLLMDVGWSPDSVGLVAVASGPGSFTGLRIGVTTAKSFAYAVGAEVLGVDTLRVLAEQAPRDARSIWAVLDAQRQQVFAAKFAPSSHGDGFATVNPTLIMTRAEWLAKLSPGDTIIGPPVMNLKTELPDGILLAPEDAWEPKARSVASVAWQSYQRGERSSLWTLVPAYYRASAAEEKAANRKS